MSVMRPFIAGTVLSLGAVAGLAHFDPGRVAFPHLSPRHLVASYMALADAPFGNGLELFALVAVIFAACFLMAGWWQQRGGS